MRERELILFSLLDVEMKWRNGDEDPDQVPLFRLIDAGQEGGREKREGINQYYLCGETLEGEERIFHFRHIFIGIAANAPHPHAFLISPLIRKVE